MSVVLTEEQVLDIHLNSRINGGRCMAHTLIKRNGITVNEYYAVMRMDLKKALKRAKAGRRFISWEPGVKHKPTKDEVDNSKQRLVLQKHSL